MPFPFLPARRALVLAALCCAALPAYAQGTPTSALPPIEAFFDNPAFVRTAISPGGDYLAAITSAKEGRKVLAVIDLKTKKATVAASYADADIGRFQWVNNERLAYSLGNEGLAAGETYYGGGLYAVNRDGTKLVQLARRDNNLVQEGGLASARRMLPYHTYMLDQPGAQDSEFLYVESPERDEQGYGRNILHVNLLRLNTLTGAAQTVGRPAAVKDWMLDHQGQPRLAIAVEKNLETIYYRDPARDQWRVLATFDAYTGAGAAFNPIGFGPDGTLYATSHSGEDTAALRSFDFATGKLGKDALVAIPGYDFSGVLIGNRSKLLGARITTDARGNVWFDPAMQALQTSIDKALPGLTNLLSPAADPNAEFVLVESFSDKVPPRYALYNTRTAQLGAVGSTHARIVPEQMGRQEPHTYKARDGLPIPALLTLPPGGVRKNLPMVVLVHGGPWVRGASWGWDDQSQFLATRGYAVLEPAFRGSTGLGRKHFAASFKQWGLAMQNDIADGARWAIAQGIADPKRICIAGASYGGYATLMGLINDPDLFKCGVNWVGVTDINLMYNETWLSASDAGDDWKKFGMPRLIGDQVADAAQLKATSPIVQAARIKQPLLLAYGGNDRRVPIVQGKLFYEAVRKTNDKVIWIDYPQEGHGWYLQATNIDFWSRVEKFLAQNIGQP